MAIKRPILKGIPAKAAETKRAEAESPPISGQNLEVPPQYTDFFTRISDRVGTTSVVGAMAEWITKNTYLEDAPYSFANHEYALDIANDTSPDGVIVKCSQVGLTELAVRISLGLIAVSSGLSLIYVLPSAAFASEFGKARINPVIESSPKLSSMLVTASNSSKMKRIGSGILYVGGAASKKQAISRPAQALIIDEFDFCNMAVLTSYNGRLRHVLPPKKPFKRKFSTPTVQGYGISKEYSLSTEKRYLCKCLRCGHWHAPDFRTEVVIPGWKGEDFRAFSREDLLNESYFISQAYIRCVRCGKELDSSLAMPEQREWVAKFPNRSVTGWAVKPYDLIAYNTTESVIRQLLDYHLDSDYWNFVHGETYESELNQINIDTVKKCRAIVEQLSGSGCYMGIDVGAKYCHVMIGKRIDGKRHVLRAVKLRAPNFIQQILDLFQEYNCYGLVIDAMPDATLGQEIIKEVGQYARQCYYIKGDSKKKQYFHVEEDTNIIHCARTRAFDVLVQDINKGNWVFPLSDEMEKEAIPHFQGMKRVDKVDEVGEKVARWVKVEADHYMHAAMYLKLAMDIDDDEDSESNSVIAVPVTVSGVHIGKKIQVVEGIEAKNLMSMLGIR